MNVDDALRDLLPLLYAAPIEPAKWQIFLDLLCHLTEIPSGYLISSRTETGSVCLAAGGADFDPEAIALYNNQYGANDPFRAAFLARPRVGVIDGEELVRREDLIKTEMWNEVLSPYGLHHVTMLCGNCDKTGIEALSFWRDSHQGPLDSGSLQLLQALVPHVQATLRLNARLHVAESSGALSETALDALEIMVVLVNARSRIQHMNLLAAKRLPGLSAIGIQCGRLVAADTGDDSRLQDLIQSATAQANRTTGGQFGGAMKIRQAATPGDLQISVVPASERTQNAQSARCAAIFIGEPQSPPRLRGEILREVYRLTATEARLADCLLEGKELRDAAQQLCITWATARFHLKRVFAKTGTRRQAELMRLMLSLPARID
jgi:DNA-binding CsgD family transcriptional regulator